MKVLVIGSACREHAIIQALLEDRDTTRVYSLPERPSLRHLISHLPSSLLEDWQALIHRLKSEGIELVIIGPEKPIVEGLSDFLREKGFKVFAPSARAGRLEGSKLFAKKFMKKQGILTASFHELSSVPETLRLAQNFTPPFVLKADGLAAGKGVFICKDLRELEEKSKLLFEKKIFGPSGAKAIIEDFQPGRELSVFAITNGESFCLLPLSQDYKRLYEGQKGPNTGGMGAFAPVDLSPSLIQRIETQIIQPTLKGLREEQALYRGVLYFGLMIHKGIPRVLEYNVRFGDPEAQVLLPLLDGSWLKVFYQTACGQEVKLKWKKLYTACVALCAKNYPAGPLTEEPIKGSIDTQTEHSRFIHGSLVERDGQWWTSGGRVLNALGWGKTLPEAVQRAYQQAESVSWPGMRFRKDIGKKIGEGVGAESEPTGPTK